MNLSASDSYVQKPNRFPWGRFVGFTAVILVIIVVVRLVPDYIQNQYLYVINGEYAEGLEQNLQEALAITPIEETSITVDALAPNIKLHCGDFFEQAVIDSPLNVQTCQADYGYIALHNIDENIMMYPFTTLMVFDGSDVTFSAQVGQGSSDNLFSGQLLINSYLEGSLTKSRWSMDGFDSNLLVPIYDETETAVVGAIFIETPPPSGFFDISFLFQIATFYLPFALLLAYVVINLSKQKRQAASQ